MNGWGLQSFLTDLTCFLEYIASPIILVHFWIAKEPPTSFVYFWNSTVTSIIFSMSYTHSHLHYKTEPYFNFIPSRIRKSNLTFPTRTSCTSVLVLHIFDFTEFLYRPRHTQRFHCNICSGGLWLDFHARIYSSPRRKNSCILLNVSSQQRFPTY